MQITAESVFTEADQLCDEILDGTEIGRKIFSLSFVAVCGSSLYGFSMGLQHSPPQALSAALKVPTLFLLTLGICLPTLHFIGLLFGTRVKVGNTLVVLLTGISLTCVLLGAFTPISIFFLTTGSSYPFLLLMHVSIFAFCGAAGLYSISKNYNYIRGKIDASNEVSNQLLKVWMFLYMFVGTQTAYSLAPFMDKETNFTLFHRPDGNFYIYFWQTIQEFLLQYPAS